MLLKIFALIFGNIAVFFTRAKDKQKNGIFGEKFGKTVKVLAIELPMSDME